MKEELVARTVSLLREHGYAVSECCSVRSCFDILAKKDDSLLLIKVLVNIEGVTSKLAAELRVVSAAFGAAPIIIGEHMKNTPLSPGVVYTRYDIHVMSIDAFEETLSRRGPSVYSIRGNYCVRVNGALLSELRQRVDMTQEELAEKLGVSKQSIHRYESSGRVSLDIAEKMIRILSEDLLVPGEVLAAASCRAPEVPESSTLFRTELEKTVYYEFRKIGLEPSLTNAPFDILAMERERRQRILTIASDDHRGLKRKVEIIQVMSEMTDSRPVCVSNRSCRMDVPVIRPKDLSAMKEANDLFRLLE